MKPRAVAEQFRVSRRTIERIAREDKIRSDADGIMRREGDDGTAPGDDSSAGVRLPEMPGGAHR